MVLGRPQSTKTRPLAAVSDHKARYSLRIEILAYPTCAFDATVGGGGDIAKTFDTAKLEWCGYLTVKNLKMC